jgi:hypothetical protein
MPSAVDIANLALMQIGDQTITSFSDGITRANVVDAFYPIARDAVLEEHPWNFAEKRVALAQIAGDTPAFEFSYFYQLPADCIRVRYIDETDPEYPHKVEGDRLLCDLSAVNLLYTRRVTDPNRFSPLFVEALMYKLASMIAMPLLKNSKLALEMAELYTLALGKAKGSDALQGTADVFTQDDLTRDR